MSVEAVTPRRSWERQLSEAADLKAARPLPTPKQTLAAIAVNGRKVRKAVMDRWAQAEA